MVFCGKNLFECASPSLLLKLCPLPRLAGSLMNPFNLNTGVSVFAEHLTLAFFEPPSTVGVVLVDSTNFTFNLVAEEVNTVSVSGLNLTQVNFRLPLGIAPGKCVIKLVLHSHVSNSASFRIVP